MIIVGPSDIFFRLGGGQHNHRYLPQLWGLFDRLKHLYPIHARQAQVK